MQYRLQMNDKEILMLCLDEKTRDIGFKHLLSAYSKKIYYHVRRMINDHDDANDVVQNCFIKAWKGLPNFREDSQLFTWLYRIATNESLTFLQDRYRKNTSAVAMDTVAHSSQLVEEAWIDGETLQERLQEAIDTLPPKQKQVFVMRYFDEMKYEEMENILGTSTGALKASFHHAVKKIETILKDGLNLG